MAGINAVQKVRALFMEKKQPMTLSEIKAGTDLRSSDVSMAMCYFVKNGFATRKKIDNKIAKARKTVWLYTYEEIRRQPPNGQ